MRLLISLWRALLLTRLPDYAADRSTPPRNDSANVRVRVPRVDVDVRDH